MSSPAGHSPLRFVSLVPSVTETTLAWGLVPLACTRFCEQPDLPHVGGTKNPDVDAIVALAPDVIVMCDEENRRADADALVAAGLAVHSCSPRSVAEVGPALAELAVALHADAPPIDPPPEVSPLGLRAWVPIWRRPWITIAADTYGTSVLATLGVSVVGAAPTGTGAEGDRYPVLSKEEALAACPDVVLAPSEPYPFAQRHVAELSEVARVMLVDGQDLFWWGVRTPAAVARLHAELSASC